MVGNPDAVKFGVDVDAATFEQILEMDDDEDREFSQTLYTEFKQQAEQAIVNMEAYLGVDSNDTDTSTGEPIEPTVDSNVSDDEKLRSLSSLGHFLKGSSSTLGLTKVQKGCEKIQHFGSHKDESGEESDSSTDQLFEKLKETIVQVKKDYTTARSQLDKFYGL